MSTVLLVFMCRIMCFIAQKSCIRTALVAIYLDVTLPILRVLILPNELINKYSLFCICVDTYSSWYHLFKKTHFETCQLEFVLNVQWFTRMTQTHCFLVLVIVLMRITWLEEIHSLWHISPSLKERVLSLTELQRSTFVLINFFIHKTSLLKIQTNKKSKDRSERMSMWISHRNLKHVQHD